MIAPSILRYFQAAMTVNALDTGFRYAEEIMNWSVSDRARLYQVADRAFGAAADYDAFSEIYNELVRYWKIGRNGNLASSDEIFMMLTDGCALSSRQSGKTLINDDASNIKNTIHAMRNVKRMGQYPHMAASKFLHFYNPRLFPIYDDAVIWKMVLNGAFKLEWNAVCRDYGIKVWEPSERFLITYTSWAAQVMKAADPDLMLEFGKRFRDRGGREAADMSEIEQYYATAFEYVLIGAAALKSSA